MFRLSDEEREYLRSIGYPEKDFGQIQVAANRSRFFDENLKQISANKASAILGRYRFLAGIGRSAFHWTACQVASSDESTVVHFDSSALFKRWP